jgi:hypothetical protein
MSNVIKLVSKIATVTINNSITETDLVNFDVPAYGLEFAEQSIRVKMAGEFLNNTGAAATLTFKVKLGTTTILTTAALSLAQSANRRKWDMEVELLATAADTQRIRGTLQISDADAETFANHSTDGEIVTGYGTATEMTSDALTFVLTGQLGTANASIEVTCTMTQAELLK